MGIEPENINTTHVNTCKAETCRSRSRIFASGPKQDFADLIQQKGGGSTPDMPRFNVHSFVLFFSSQTLTTISYSRFHKARGCGL